MRKTNNLFKILITIVLGVLSSVVSAQTVNVFTDDVTSFPDQIHWSDNWEGLNTTAGIQKDDDGDYILGNWRGSVRVKDVISSWAVDDTVTITIELKYKNVSKVDAPGMAFFGLVDTNKFVPKDLGWATCYEGVTMSGETTDAINFTLKQSVTPDPDGKMQVSMDLNSTYVDYAMADIGLDGIGAANVPYSDTIQYIYKLVKAAAQDSFYVSMKINNLSTDVNVLDMPYKRVMQSTIYNASDLAFFEYSNKLTTSVAALSLKVDKTINNEPKTDVSLLNSNGTFATGAAAGIDVPETVTSAVDATAAYSDFSDDNYGLHITQVTPNKMAHAYINDINFEIGKTYTVEMRVKVPSFQDYTNTTLLVMRLMEKGTWSDATKETMTKSGAAWGLELAENTWTRISFSKEITTAFKEGSSVGDIVTSSLAIQSIDAGDIEYYIDEIRVYEGALVVEATSNFIEPVDQSTQLSQASKKSLDIYPNPAQSILTLSAQVEEASIYNLNGTLLKSVRNTATIEVSDLSAGIYFLRANNEIVKFVKQ